MMMTIWESLSQRNFGEYFLQLYKKTNMSYFNNKEVVVTGGQVFTCNTLHHRIK